MLADLLRGAAAPPRPGASPLGGDTIRFDVDRVTIEPFDLRQPSSYDLVVDRLTHWYTTSREWIKKAVLMDGLYVFNNPWAIQSMEKHTSYCAMMRLGMPIPDTWMVPPKDYEPKPDLEITLERYARLFDLDEVGEAVGYPLFVKPYDGGGWAGVSRVDDDAALHRAYDESGTYLLHLQRAVEPHDLFVRCIGFGPQTRLVRYDPSAPLHDRYTMDDGGVPDDQRADARRHDADDQLVLRLGLQLVRGAAPGRDVAPDRLRQRLPRLAGDVAALPLPVAGRRQPALVDLLRGDEAADAASTSTGRRTSRSPTREAPYGEKLAAYAAIARERFQTDEFEAFCATHLAHLDEVVWEFFATDIAHDAVRQKVAALFPAHEVDLFTDAVLGPHPALARRRTAPAASRDDASCRRRRGTRRGRARGDARPLGHVRHAGAGVPDRRRRRRGDRALPPRRRLR